MRSEPHIIIYDYKQKTHIDCYWIYIQEIIIEQQNSSIKSQDLLIRKQQWNRSHQNKIQKTPLYDQFQPINHLHFILKLKYIIKQSYLRQSCGDSLFYFKFVKISDSSLYSPENAKTYQLQQFRLKMAAAQHKTLLPRLLSKISLKLNSYFFKRLILYEQQHSFDVNVRHYDLECQGIQILMGFFKTKQQNLLLKTFTAIKQNINTNPQNIVLTQKGNNGTTRRTYLNTTFTGSESSPIKEIQYRTIRSQRSQHRQNQSVRSQPNKSSVDLQKLLTKVKLANSRKQSIYSFRQIKGIQGNEQNFRQNYSCHPQKKNQWRLQEHRYRTNPSQQDQNEYNYYDYYKSQMINTRNSRRQFILAKFNQIESSLHQLTGRQEIKKPTLNNEIMNEIKNIKQKLKLKR